MIFAPAKSRVLLLLCLILLLLTALPGCGRVFDRSAFIKAVLDANYLMKYDALAQNRLTTTESIANEHQEFIRQEVRVFLQFCGLPADQSIPDDLNERIYDSLEKIYAQVRYEVQDADKNSQVTIRVTPVMLYPDIYAPCTEAAKEFRTANNKARYGRLSEEDYLRAYLEPLINVLEYEVNHVTYGEPQDVTVLVFPDAAARYSITNEDADRLYAALIIYDVNPSDDDTT